MAKLSHERINEEVTNVGYTLIDDSTYVNMNSPITVQCKNGHKLQVSINDLKRPSFVCPCCDKSINFINPREVPQKNGYRVIAFDQATEHFGLSI